MKEPQARSKNEQQRIGTTFSSEELAKIDDWGFSKKIRSRSEVIRKLVAEGLNAEMKTATE